MSIRDLLFGKPLRAEEARKEEIGVWSGVPVLGLDALASASYGPEAALTVLMPLGVLSAVYVVPVTLCIIGVLLAVCFSYQQTIGAYPNGGGSFTVAKENLGRSPGLLAATTLSIDYLLNVAVAISAGVGALVSAVPSLLHYTLPLCLIVLVILTIANLRGVRSAGLIFMLPTCLFVGCLSTAIIAGIVKAVLAHGHPVPMVAPPKAPAHAAVSAWLLMRAFASGCTALTGVEAVSNAVPIFRKPTIPRARGTLLVIVIILAFLLAGVAVLARCYGIGATPPGQSGYQSVLSQMVAAVLGRGVFYYVTIASIMMVLALSANTSFAGFPRVCRLLALDEYLPAQFAHRGSRLVYSSGIIALAILAGALLIAFGGITDRLIPLFAVGAFMAFTLSQIGMVAHWRRVRGKGSGCSLAANAVGAAATASTLVIIAISKFVQGAWLTLMVIPPITWLFFKVRRYYERLDRKLAEHGPLSFSHLVEPIIIVPMKRLDRVGRKGLRFALTLSAEVHAVQILAEELQTENLSSCWQKLVARPARAAGYREPRLVVVKSAYREFFNPLFEYVENLARHNPGRHIAVVIPELIERRWYRNLFRPRATLLKAQLLLKGGPQIEIITTPWYVRR